MYGDSHALSSSDSCSIFESISKQKDETLLREQVRDKQLLPMDSGANTFYSVFRHDLMSRVNDNSSGLLRFRSAPTSLLENFKNEKLDSRICYGDDDVANSMHVIVSENNDDDDDGCNNKRFTAMNSQLPPQYPRQGYRSALSSSVQQGQNGKFGSGLLRQNSSPAGLFSSQNGYAGGNVEFKNHMNYSSGRGPSSLGMLSRISEIENENPGQDQGKRISALMASKGRWIMIQQTCLLTQRNVRLEKGQIFCHTTKVYPSLLLKWRSCYTFKILSLVRFGPNVDALLIHVA